ncbi:hypothetical protein ACSLNT_30360, partial [Escherichia coli]
GNYTDKFGESGTEQCWKNWASGKKDKTTNKHKKIPTSDVYVIFQHLFRWISKQSVLSEILMMTVAPVIYERVFDRY